MWPMEHSFPLVILKFDSFFVIFLYRTNHKSEDMINITDLGLRARIIDT